jgi:protein O-GlcNAc transferase
VSATDATILIQHALGFHRQGQLDRAADLYEQILEREPSNAAAMQLLGTLRSQQGRYVEAIRLIEAALALQPNDFGALANYGQMLLASGRCAQAVGAFDKALTIKPDFFEAHYNKGVALTELKRFAEAATSYDKAIAVNPNSAQCFYNRGVALAALGWLEDALASYDEALARQPKFVRAFDNRGNVKKALGRPQEALVDYDRALSIEPDNLHALYNRAAVLSDLGRLEEALLAYDRVFAIQPQFGDALFSKAVTLLKLERPAQALENLDQALAQRPGDGEILANRAAALWQLRRFAESRIAYDQALAASPDHVAALLGRALLLQDMGDPMTALVDYERALAIVPKDTRAWNGRGAVLVNLKRGREAQSDFDKAIELDPNSADALSNRAHLRWSQSGDLDGAISDLRAALAINPDQAYARGELIHMKMHGADWEGFDCQTALLDRGVREGRRVVRPFVYQALSGSPSDLQDCSRIFATSLFPAQAGPAPTFRHDHGKIRIGYVSGEFREQATAHLMAGLYECHDRSKFEVIAIDNGGGDGSAMRRRLETAFDKLILISQMSDVEAAQHIRSEQIDILVNLNGYFGAPRMGIFARRAAPIQINYLGFPGSLGADYMDYILADKVVIPENEQCHYNEKVVYLPHTYQVNDRSRLIAQEIPSRASLGLPDKEFVFCSFNQSYKITPSTFASWMRILKQVDGSVLWLLRSTPSFELNLSRAAERADVAAQRLMFAPSLPPDQHLARLSQADLFLDSLPCNAHTSASDALWAGLPLLTLRGTSFPGRVAASLLRAVGLPQLVTETEQDYETLAIRLARDRNAIEELRRTLIKNRLTTPLFDTDQFRGNIEAAYTLMWERWKTGEAPKGFAL